MYLDIHSPGILLAFGRGLGLGGLTREEEPASTSMVVPSGKIKKDDSPLPVLIWWISKYPSDQAGKVVPTCACNIAPENNRRKIEHISDIFKE
jgi:hypothetical protein